MTKAKMVDIFSKETRLPRTKAEELVSCVFDILEEALEKEQRIEIRGFGSFEIRKYKAYQGRNPRTGSTVQVKPKRLPFFKVGKELRERLNRGSSKSAGSDKARRAGR